MPIPHDASYRKGGSKSTHLVFSFVSSLHISVKRLQTLWAELKEWYETNQVHTGERLTKLTPKMVKREKTWPKLKAKAASVRALVPFMKMMGQKFAVGDQQEVRTCMAVMLDNMAAMYESLAHNDVHPELLPRHCQAFCSCLVALEQALPGIFRFKPKVHMVQELCEMSGPVCPALLWTYRDESFGGSIAACAKRRGGGKTPKGVAFHSLQTFTTTHRLPFIT